MPSQKSNAGRLGYIAALWETAGKFHQMGGKTTTRLYLYTSEIDGAVGYEAAVRDGVHIPKGKKHRYSQEQLPIAETEGSLDID